MYGEAAYAETSYADAVQLAAPIIPEVGLETRVLVIVVELDLVAAVVADIGPLPPTGIDFGSIPVDFGGVAVAM